jgi:uncharacterized phage protein gp47/JayE
LPTPTLDELLIPRTEQQVFDSLQAKVLAVAAEQGVVLPTNFTSGGAFLTILRGVASGIADVERLLPELVGAGFLEIASGPWLDLRVEDEGITRNPATFARHTLRLTAAVGFGPYTINPGQLWAGSASGLRFNNTTGGTLPAAGTLDLVFKAEQVGSIYNVATGGINLLLTPLPGVSVTNLVGSLLEVGADEEEDDALRQRARLRYPTLSQTERIALAYERIALNAHPDVRKVLIRDNLPRGQNTVDVVVWGTGGISGPALAAVDASIQSLRGITADVDVYAATQFDQAVTATIRVRAGYGSIVDTKARARLQDLEDRYPIGGEGGLLYRSQISDALFVPDSEIPGRNGLPNVVQDVALTVPAGNPALTPLQVVKFTPLTLTIVEV